MINVEAILMMMKYNDEELSRTVSTGTVDISISSTKLPSLLSGSELLDVVRTNRQRVAQFIVKQAESVPTSKDEVVASLIAIAILTNDQINRNGLFRKWEYSPKVLNLDTRVEPPKIFLPLRRLGEVVLKARHQDLRHRTAVVSGIEWEIGIGPIHPFSDGCGRISRYFSILLSLWLDVQFVRHTSRPAYMAEATKGKRSFIKYYGQLAQH